MTESGSSPSGSKEDSWQGVIPIRNSDPTNIMPWEKEEDQEQNTAQRSRNIGMRADLKKRQEALAASGKDDSSALKATDEHIEVPKSKFAEDEQESLTSANSKELPPWCKHIDVQNRVLKLHMEIMNFINFLEATDEELKARNDWIDS